MYSSCAVVDIAVFVADFVVGVAAVSAVVVDVAAVSAVVAAIGNMCNMNTSLSIGLVKITKILLLFPTFISLSHAAVVVVGVDIVAAVDVGFVNLRIKIERSQV